MVAFDYLQTSWVVLDKALEADWARLQKFRPGRRPDIKDISHDQKTWVITYYSSDAPTSSWLFRRGAWPPVLLFENQPELNRFKLAKQHPVVVTARDGLRLPSYLTLPTVRRGADSGGGGGGGASKQQPLPGALPPSVSALAPGEDEGPGRAGGDARGAHFATPRQLALAARPSPLNLSLPLVLYVHGGPWSRDSYGFDAVNLWLADRGYAVLQVRAVCVCVWLCFGGCLYAGELALVFDW